MARHTGDEEQDIYKVTQRWEEIRQREEARMRCSAPDNA